MIALRKKTEFPFNIKQESEIWCIPATIQAVTRYCVDMDVPQKWIWERWVAACCEEKIDPLTIWFGSIKKLVLDREKQFTSWAEAEASTSLPNFTAVCDKIKDSLVADVPPIVSTPVFYNGIHTGWHMLCVIAYNNNALEVHDPNPLVPAEARSYPTAQLKSDLKMANSRATHLLLLNRRP